jgi:hypothetical protein
MGREKEWIEERAAEKVEVWNFDVGKARGAWAMGVWPT